MASASDHQFRILVDTIRDYAIFLLDTRGNIASWNEGARRIKGYEASEVIGRHFSMFYPPGAPAGTWDRQLAAAERDGRVEDYGWRVRKDGSRFWANVIMTALRDDDGKLFGYAKVTRDMTDRAYRTFVEATNAIVWTTDAEGRPNADSPTWREFTGQTEEEWRGRKAWDPVHPGDLQKMQRSWAAAKRDGAMFEQEFRLRRKDGDYQWMAVRAVPLRDADGGVREWFGVTFDVSTRKHAELALHVALEREQAARVAAEQAQARWTTTLDSIGDAVIATDADGRVRFMNGVAQRLTGFSLDEGGGRSLREVFPIVNEDTRQPVEDPVAKVLRVGAIVGLANHTVLVRRDGTDLPIDDSAAPIRDESGRLFGVVLVFRDVSTEKREEARRAYLLRAGEELLSVTDYKSALRTVVQLAVPRLADWCAVDIVEPGSPDLQRLAVAHVDPAKVTAALELGRKYPPRRNDATGVWNVIRTGHSELYRVIPRELLEQAAEDDEHREMIRRLHLHSAMVVPLRGREQIFGAMTFVHAESAREYGEDDLAFAEELARRAALVIERRKLADERALLLEAERRARAHAEVANRAKDEFLAMVSHELRNPLSAIVGWSKLLLQRDLPPELRDPIQTIERNARAQARLIEDMLDVSRIISGKLQLDVGAANVAQAVSDAVEASRRAAEAKGIQLESRVEPDLELRADQVRLQQIVSNLVTNAVKFTPRGGTVTITAAREYGGVRVVVRDTGEGIEPNMIEAIFEPFRQADATTTRRHGGLGLGLAIVRQLVHAHGGTIRAESEGAGKGATFSVDLPTNAAPRSFASLGSETPPPPSPAPLPRLDRTRVLVVDDQPELVELMTAVLTSVGAEVTGASSAAEALAAVPRARPDVIVSDIGMPEIDGYELMRRVRALPPGEGGRTPAIAVTAYARREDAERAFASGFQRHVAKPIEPRDIVVAVANLAGIPLAEGR